MSDNWEVVAKTRVKRTGYIRVKSSLEIEVRDQTKYDGYFPSVRVRLYSGGTTWPHAKLFSVIHQPKLAKRDSSGISRDRTQQIVGEALEMFIEEAVDHIQKRWQEMGNEARIQQHLDAAATSEKVDRIFDLADELREVK